MAKKRTKKTNKKKTPTKIVKATTDTARLNSILIENFVKLQKAMTNITVKFDNLSNQMSKLLQLFEISAKSFAEKLSTGVPDIEKDREFLDKLNKLLDQNKVIAKGLTLMEEKLRERVYGGPSQRPPRPAPRPAFAPRTPPPPPTRSGQGYLPSSLSQGKKTRELK